MTPSAVAHIDGIETRAVLHPVTPRHGLPARLRQSLGVMDDLVMLLLLAAFVPLVILAVGAPIALLVKLLLWIGGLF